MCPFHLHKRKNGSLSWRSMENSSWPNFGNVSHIHFKLGRQVDHKVASHDMSPRSKDHTNYTSKISYNSVISGDLSLILGWYNVRTIANLETLTGCHGNGHCLPIGPSILLFATVYFSNEIKSNTKVGECVHNMTSVMWSAYSKG